jgi:hypothetical protein
MAKGALLLACSETKDSSAVLSATALHKSINVNAMDTVDSFILDLVELTVSAGVFEADFLGARNAPPPPKCLLLKLIGVAKCALSLLSSFNWARVVADVIPFVLRLLGQSLWWGLCGTLVLLDFALHTGQSLSGLKALSPVKVS